jgi:hypothetical protein
MKLRIKSIVFCLIDVIHRWNCLHLEYESYGIWMIRIRKMLQGLRQLK